MFADETDQYIVRSRLEFKSGSGDQKIAGVTGSATNQFSTPGTVGSLEVARLAYEAKSGSKSKSSAAADATAAAAPPPTTK